MRDPTKFPNIYFSKKKRSTIFVHSDLKCSFIKFSINTLLPSKYFILISIKKTNYIAPFYGCSSTALGPQPLWGGSLLFTTKFPEIPGTHFIDLGRMKVWVDLGATQWFWTQDTWIWIQHLNHKAIAPLIIVQYYFHPHFQQATQVYLQVTQVFMSQMFLMHLYQQL